MTASGVAGVALLVMLGVAGALGVFRRRWALRLGDPYPRNLFPGSVWAGAVRGVAIAAGLLAVTVITLGDPFPLVDRLFPSVTPGVRAQIVVAFHEVFALVCVAIAASAVLVDVAVTFVRSNPARRMLMGVLTLAVVASIAYGALFVVALLIS